MYRTNFFYAAEDVTDISALTAAQFGSSLTSIPCLNFCGYPYSPSALGDLRSLGRGLLVDVNRPTYRALYDGNADFVLASGVTVGAAAIGGTASLDAALVRAEQSYVQKFLDGLPPARRAALIAESNSALNGRFSPANADAAKLQLGVAQIDFGNQAHREAIGFEAIRAVIRYRAQPVVTPRCLPAGLTVVCAP